MPQNLRIFDVLPYNDLSDNGKSFQFGYDNSSDTYGYYKNGVFTGFGGGGVSTLCKIKGAAFFKAGINGSYVSSRGVYAVIYDTDGYTESYMSTTDDTSGICSKYSTLLGKLSFIGTVNIYSISGYIGAGINITAAVDGYYSWMMGQAGSAASLNQPTPTFLSAGTTILSNDSTGPISGPGDTSYIIYYGIDIS